REGAAFDETRIAMEKIVAGAYSAVGGESSALYQSLSVTAGGRLGGGGGPPGTSAGTQLASNIGEATLTLAPAGERDTSSEEIAKRWREAVGDLPGVKSLSFNASLIGAGADVSVDLVHEDDAALESAVESLEAALRGMNGVGEIESGLDRGKRQLSFKLTPAGAAAGLTTNDIARQVRQAFFGEEVQRIQRGREEVLVYVRYPADQRRSVASLERLRIRLAGGGEAPLGVVADIVESVSPTTIERVDGRRVVSIEASVDDTITTPSAVNAILASEILPRIAAETPRLRYSFEGTTRDQSEDLGTLANNLYIAVGIIFILLASVLRSYTKPLIIMAAIPFAASSAVWGHLLMGYDLSFLSLFGVVALTGVVINDSVVLLDYDNKLREQGFNAYDAAIASVRRRFRPILLTTLTTFLGLAPMLAETSLQARFLIPMAISLGFGILFTGFIIFVLVPSLLMIGDDISRGLARVSGRLAAPGPAE
ncbi:MAG: efflux RND transporter permease subunit, partial [Pseudomonadota bacterium]